MYLTINSEFKPFTYDELTKPLRDYTEAYNKVEEQYATLAQQTEAWKNIATQENSPEAYAMYKKYADELNAVVEDFSKGMTIQNRSKLSGLKSRYASEITPISTAYTALSNANAFRDEMRIKDDSVIFNIDRYTSLDDFLNGQMVDNSFVSGRSLQADVANQIITNGYNKYNELISTGHSKRAAAKIVEKGDWIDKSSMLSNIYDNAGITTEEAKNKIKNYTDQAMSQGLTTLSANINQTLLQEQAARARRGGGGGGGSRTSSKFNYDNTAARIYDALGYDQTREEKTTTETFYQNDLSGEYEPSSKNEVKKAVPVTKSEKIAFINKYPDLRKAMELIEGGGYTEEYIIGNLNEYLNSDYNGSGYGNYISLKDAYNKYKKGGGEESFDVFIEKYYE